MKLYARIGWFAVMLFIMAPALAVDPSNFVMPSDVARRYPIGIRPAGDYVDTRVLGAASAEVWTAPANTRIVIFSADCDFWAKKNAAAAVPAADVSDGTSSTLNPSAWYFSTPVTTIGLISATACKISIEAFLGPVQ